MILDHGVSPYWNSLNASARPGLVAPILDWTAGSGRGGAAEATAARAVNG